MASTNRSGYALQKLVDVLGLRLAHTMEPLDIAKFTRTLQPTLNPTSQAIVLRVVQRCFNWGVENRLIPPHIDKKLPFDAGVFRQKARAAALAASRSCRQVADNLSSFGVECFTDDKGNFKDSSVRMVRAGDSAGQGLLAYGKRVVETTSADDLQFAIAETWLYRDKQYALRWDPEEDRGYALQWGNPSDDGALSLRGANCLALFAMSFLPTIPVRGQVETAGFGLKEPKQASLTWPVWKHPINPSAISSLLTLSTLQRNQPDRLELDSLGVAAAYRCNRVMTSTYYANFTPSQRIA